MLRSGLVAMLMVATLLAMAGLPQPRTESPHPLEGLYEVSITTDTGEVIRFLVSLKSESGKWVGEVRDLPVTVKEVTVTGESNPTIIATATTEGMTGTITIKFEGSKLTSSVKIGEQTITLSGARKETEGQATATIEGTYEAQASAEGEDPLLFVLTIKRTKPADK